MGVKKDDRNVHVIEMVVEMALPSDRNICHAIVDLWLFANTYCQKKMVDWYVVYGSATDRY
jgi:hypothetical protein